MSDVVELRRSGNCPEINRACLSPQRTFCAKLICFDPRQDFHELVRDNQLLHRTASPRLSIYQRAARFQRDLWQKGGSSIKASHRFSPGAITPHVLATGNDIKGHCGPKSTRSREIRKLCNCHGIRQSVGSD
jgi:hypothetical protein